MFWRIYSIGITIFALVLVSNGNETYEFQKNRIKHLEQQVADKEALIVKLIYNRDYL